VSDPGLHGGIEVARHAALQQHVGHQQEQRHRQQDEVVGGTVEPLRDHDRRETTGDQQHQAETAKGKGDRQAGRQQHHEGDEDECGFHARR
jgi:hypothetical protein